MLPKAGCSVPVLREPVQWGGVALTCILTGPAIPACRASNRTAVVSVVLEVGLCMFAGRK